MRTAAEGTARGSVSDRQGVYYIPDVEVAGKTGSLTGKRAPGLNYNWFVGYAPADRPEIAFAVLLANEPKWQIKAHYAARRLVQIYLQRRTAIAEHRDARLGAQGLELPGQPRPPGARADQPARQPERQPEPPNPHPPTPNRRANGTPSPLPPGLAPPSRRPLGRKFKINREEHEIIREPVAIDTTDDFI